MFFIVYHYQGTSLILVLTVPGVPGVPGIFGVPGVRVLGIFEI